VADPTVVKAGYIEIDNELVRVSGGDSSGNVTVFPWGRAQRGTVAAAHTAGAKVTVNPLIASATIQRMISEAVTGLYPMLFSINTDETNTYNPVVVGYPLTPIVWSNGTTSDLTGVGEVSYQVIGPSNRWDRITRFKFIPEADSTTFPSGKAVEVYGPAFPGRKLKIVTRSNFGQFVNTTDTFESIGLRSEWRDIVRLDTCYRLIPSLDAARLQTTTIEAAGRATAAVQPLQASSVAKQLQQSYELRVANERRRLLIDYPSTQQRQN
jgi:hypothetical protein